MQQSFYRFGAVYGEGSYGSSVYSCDENDTACLAGSVGSAGSASGGSGGLANTGVAVLGFATLASLIIFTALVVRMMGKRKKSLHSTSNT